MSRSPDNPFRVRRRFVELGGTMGATSADLRELRLHLDQLATALADALPLLQAESSGDDDRRPEGPQEREASTDTRAGLKWV